MQKSKSAALWFGAIIILMLVGFSFLKKGGREVIYIESVFPRQIAAGEPLVISGKGFSPTAKENTVTVNGKTLEVLESGQHYIIAVPKTFVEGGSLTVMRGSLVSNPFLVAGAGHGSMGGMGGGMPAMGGTPKSKENAIKQTAGEDKESGEEESGGLPHQFFSPEEAKNAQAFALKDFAGKNVNLSDYKGKLILLNFWASWCKPCLEELPSLLKLAEGMKGRDFSVLAVSVDKNWDDVKKVVDPKTSPITVLLDAESKTPHDYGTRKFPESYVITPDGKIIAKFIGSRNWESPTFANFFESLLRDKTGEK